METELILEGITFPKMSARGCIQELMPLINPALFKRTVNNELIYLGNKNDEKYKSIIKCNDKDIPALNHLWAGSIVTVHCMQHLYQEVKEGVTEIKKRYVKGSLKAYNNKHEMVQLSEEGSKITIKSEKGYIQFRPILDMYIKNFNYSYDEWGAKVGWSLELEEV
jgi:hypothetical protein